MNLKRIISGILSTVMFASIMPMSLAAEEYDVNVSYEKTADGYRASANYVYPDTYTEPMLVMYK